MKLAFPKRVGPGGFAAIKRALWRNRHAILSLGIAVLVFSFLVYRYSDSIVEQALSIAAVFGELFHAWQQWITGPTEPTKILLGHPMYYWSRLGKIFELGALVVIVVDLIGPERLRAVGARFGVYHASEVYKRVANKYSVPIFVLCAVGYTVFMLVAFAIMIKEKPPAWPALGMSSDIPFIIQIVINAFAIAIATAVILFVLGVALFAIVMVSALLLTLVIFIYVFLAMQVVEPLLRVIAWALEKPNVSWWVKVVSVILFVIGFHFDLLTS